MKEDQRTSLPALEQDLLDLYERMIGETDLTRVLLQVTEVVQKTFDAERATIYLIREETSELESVAVIGNVARTIRLPISATSLAGYCAHSRRLYLIDDAYGDLSAISPDLEFDASWDRLNDFRTRDVMCAPVAFRDELLGVIQVINSRGEPFNEESLTLLRVVSRLVSYSLYHARVYDELVTLKAVKKQKAQFMRVLVHELKSPASGAKMLATNLHYVHKDDPKMGPVLGRINARMDGLLDMIEDILNLSRIQEGGALGAVEVLDLVQETMATCEPYVEEAQNKNLLFKLVLPEDPVPVHFDRQGYQLVVSNLVSNAVKYTEAGGVTVRLEQSDGWATLTVSDTGIGIPQEDIPQMFREFFRASNAKSAGIKGTGVGLAGAKEIVERFGGHLELESRENAGTEFRVRLRLHAG